MSAGAREGTGLTPRLSHLSQVGPICPWVTVWKRSGLTVLVFPVAVPGVVVSPFTWKLERLYVLLGIALLLPAMTVLILQTYNGYRSEAAARQAQALAAADGLLLLSDARAASDLAAVRLLAGSQYIKDRDLVAGARRAQEAIAVIPGWTAVILSEFDSGRILFAATETEVTREGTLPPLLVEDLRRGGIGRVVREGPHCPCVYMHAAVPGQGGAVLSVAVDPQVFQDMLRHELPAGAIAAIVDRDGKFIARSLDYGNRVGTPATQYVQAAVMKGGRGIYQGTTFEGLVNYTAYATSPTTGWSGHVAIDSDLLDGPLQRANVALWAAALAAIIVALALFLIAVRETGVRRQQEQRMLELQRTEAIAQFTATIVHDFRNVVSALQSGMRMIKKKTRNDEIRSHVELIEQSIDRGTRLANRLLSFSQGGETTLQSNNLREFFDNLEFLIAQAVGREVEVTVAISPASLSVRANTDQLEMAILNLAMNARDAMNGRGRFKIEAHERGAMVELRISDDGPGIAPDRRDAIFTPFVTTKALGTGLGLAQVAGMTRNAGGRVHVEESEFGGACFVIVLPNTSGSATVDPEQPA